MSIWFTTMRGFAGLVLVASAAVLGGALASQYWGGLAPCELCLLQRWPWAVAITISIVALLVGHRPALRWVAALLGLVFVVSTAFALYHVAVEQHWIAGPSACTTGPSGAQTVAQMEASIMGRAVVLCDRVQWSLFGVSLAGWNVLASLVMAVFCGAVSWRARPGRAIAARSRRTA
jgi:disulfide bond formation protein DsbB